jgi:hypothetical protein
MINVMTTMTVLIDAHALCCWWGAVGHSVYDPIGALTGWLPWVSGTGLGAACKVGGGRPSPNR